MQKKVLLFISACVFIWSCTKESGPDGGGGNPGGTTPGPLFTSVRTVVQGNCATANCHAGSNPQNGINFTSDATIIAQKDRIKVRAVDNAGTGAQMPPPPSPALSQADQKKITDWIAAGGRLSD